MIYKGVALGPDGIPHKFASNGRFHSLDGLKLDRVMFAANVSSQEDLDVLIDFLQIVRFSLDKARDSKVPLPDDYVTFFNYKPKL